MTHVKLCKLFKICIVLISIGGLRAAADDGEYTKVCDKLKLKGALSPPLHEIEKRLVCGEGDQSKSEAWRAIPSTQAELTLRSFLKDRGYYYPDVRIQDGVFSVSVGDPTLVKATKIQGEVENLELVQDRGVIGRPLTPKLLRSLNKWVTNRLQSLGYACAFATSEGDPGTGTVKITIQSGQKLNLLRETEYQEHDLNPSALHRFDAFEFNKPFNKDLVSLTESRLIKDGLVQSVQLISHCDENGVILSQEALTGPPRMLRLGVGVSTESLFILKATWKNSRLDKNGSSISFSGYASAIDQSLNATYNWYPWEEAPRLGIKPMAQFVHVLRNSYEYYLSEGQIGPFWTEDALDQSFLINMGPDIQYFQELAGVGPDTSHFFNLKTMITAMSHDFEYYMKSPRTGYSTAVTLILNNQALASSATAEKLKVDGKYLLNFKNYDPPLFILGLRGGVATTLTNQQFGTHIGLPPPYLSFLGGSTTIRGYNLDELPESQIGGLADYYLGTELSFGSLAWNFNIGPLPQTIVPFLFADVGGIGNESFQIDSPVYWSPGIGARWASLIGPIRFTVARGYPSDTPGHFQFFFSLGEEF